MIRGISGSGLKDLARDWAAGGTGDRRRAACGGGDRARARTTRRSTRTSACSRSGSTRCSTRSATYRSVWVTHTEHAVQGREPEDERAVNDVIRAAPTCHPNVTVLDLAPEIDTNRVLVDTDALHFSEVGAAVVRGAASHRGGCD